MNSEKYHGSFWTIWIIYLWIMTARFGIEYKNPLAVTSVKGDETFIYKRDPQTADIFVICVIPSFKNCTKVNIWPIWKKVDSGFHLSFPTYRLNDSM
jgi:hypothetical protein